MAKIEWHQGELFPRVGFIVTDLDGSASQVVSFCNRRGTADQWIKEGKNAVKWTRLSCHDFVGNQVRLQLFALAYNLGSFLRRLALPNGVKHWSLTTLREKLIKIGAKVVAHSRYWSSPDMVKHMADRIPLTIAPKPHTSRRVSRDLRRLISCTPFGGVHYVVFQMAEVAVPRLPFAAIVDRIRRLRLPETVPR